MDAWSYRRGVSVLNTKDRAIRGTDAEDRTEDSAEDRLTDVRTHDEPLVKDEVGDHAEDHAEDVGIKSIHVTWRQDVENTLQVRHILHLTPNLN